MTSVQQILDIATTANATTLGTGEASKLFRRAFEESMKCRIQLKADEQSYLKQSTNFPVVFTNDKVVVSDHPLLCAMRELARDVYESCFKISNTCHRTLVVGAAAREIRKYSNNPFIHHYVYGKENKDFDRIVLPALTDIVNELKKKASKTDRKIYLPAADLIDTTKERPVLKRYTEMKEVLRDYNEAKKLPNCIHDAPVPAEVLLFEDSIYNFDTVALAKIFNETGANIAYGYCLLPMELIFKEMPENRIYKYTEMYAPKTDSFGSHLVAELTFRNGYSNGYRHPLSSWQTLLANPVFTHFGRSFAIEIIARVGVMAVFKIYRCSHPETIVRTIELQEHESYVRLLDLYSSVDHKNCKLHRPLKYFSVRESEFFEAYNYMLSLDPKSLTLQNAILYVRRRMGGMSLVSKEFVAPWALSKMDVYRFAVGVYLQSMIMTKKIDSATKEAMINSVWQKIKAFLVTSVRTVFFPITYLVDLLFAENLTDRVVLFPVGMGSITQRARAYPPQLDGKPDAYPMMSKLAADFPNEEKSIECPFCSFMNTPLDDKGSTAGGQQKFKCEYKLTSNHTFGLTTQQVNDKLVQLMNDDEDAPGLAAVKKAAKDHYPKAGFEHICRVEYVCGGPGCGKSHAIRAMADINDLIVAPFTKLKADYMDVPSVDGKINLTFKTQHRAISESGHSRIFVDEFSSFPYEDLCAIVYNNKADVVYLCGDHRQTKLKEPDEGMYIGNHMKLDELSKHELMKNFRNPQDIVQILNKRFGYEMEAVSKLEKSIIIVGPKDKIPVEQEMVSIAFTHQSAETNCQDRKCTVRSNQGGTHRNVMLYATVQDGSLPNAPELAIVAISRHKEKLYIYVDGSTTSQQFLANIGVDYEWSNTLQTYTPLSGEVAKTLTKTDSDKEISTEPWEKSGRDAHLIPDLLAPPIALNNDLASLNEESSQMVKDTFRSAKTNVDDLIMPLNVRGHPQNLTDKFMAIGPGYGLNYSGKLPMQELAVATARYDNNKKQYPFNAASVELVHEIVDLYMYECKKMGTDTFGKIIDDFLQREVQDKFLTDALKKRYPDRFRGEANNGMSRAVRFHIKSIFKPSGTMKPLDLSKAGQGISAWSAETLSLFCMSWRFLTYYDLATDRNDSQCTVLNDQGMSDIEFLKMAATSLQKVHASNLTFVLHGITDQVEFDSNQNENTQYMERYYWKSMGVSDQFLEHYYSFRSNYTMLAKTFSAKIRFEKNSGGPDTLLNNGVVSKVTSNAIVRGKGPMVIMSKGDDFDKSQLDLHVDEDMVRRLDTISPLRVRAKIADSGEFCGYLVSAVGFIPNPIRRVWKILGCRWRDYRHFTQYQQSLRDYVTVMKEVGKMKCILGAMQAQKVTTQEAEHAIEYIEAVSHVNEEQWLKMVNHYTVVPSILTTNSQADANMALEKM